MAHYNQENLLEVGTFGGMSGGPVGRQLAIKISDLNAEDAARVQAALDALKGELTYSHSISGDFYARVRLSGEDVFKTQSFSRIPDQFIDLKALASELSRTYTKGPERAKE